MDIAIKALSAERGFILLLDENRIPAEVVAPRNISESSAHDLMQIPSSVVRKVLDSRQCILSHDALEDPRFKDAKSVVALKVRSVAAVPLKIREEMIGVIYVDSTKNRKMFTQSSLEFLEAFANHAGIAIENARLYQTLQHENISLKRDIEKLYPFKEIIGESAAMKHVFDLMQKVSRSDVTVLIEGESGTGKELVARAIHANSPRCNKPFVAQYCGALQDSLLESELFGHKKGAFTGAIQDKKGLFEIAHGGTFFLDEIADISLALQTELLRVVQEGEIKAVGDTAVRKIDVRLLSATNKNLAEEVKAGRFREDLFYRLKVITISLPPLRDRGEDVILLANYFLKKYAQRLNPNVNTISTDAMKLLRSHPWHGNIRELENMIQAALVLAEGDAIAPANIPLAQTDLLETTDLNLKSMEKKLVVNALKQFGGNRMQAAAALGVSLRWLQYKLKEIDPDSIEK
ncbi:sigma 54-interacting transcriptional regulator [candidate division KSB1 bacterium]|nr:sigma 54-interacting transcriptional regulator [candidate division KSB1 bacterium]